MLLNRSNHVLNIEKKKYWNYPMGEAAGVTYTYVDTYLPIYRYIIRPIRKFGASCLFCFARWRDENKSV